MIAHIERLLAGKHLSEGESAELLRAMQRPDAEPALIGAALAGLRAKGETGDEVRGFALEMLAQAASVPIDHAGAVDIVGTGGDGSGSVNLSTGAAMLTAACRVPVVKHGNRAVSSRSGSADMLEALGYRIPQTANEARQSFDDTGFTFLFAPLYHPAMSALRNVRRALGMRTIFNILGPLINPARPPFAVIGAPTVDVARLMADALTGMSIERAFVVCGANGWDEPTPMGPFDLFEVRAGTVHAQRRDPAEFGVLRCTADDLRGGDAVHNAESLQRVCAGERSPHRDALTIGAALALEVTGTAASFEDGLSLADDALSSGRAMAFVEQLTGAEGSVRHA